MNRRNGRGTTTLTYHDCWAAIFPFLSVYLHVAGIEGKYHTLAIWPMKKAKTQISCRCPIPGGPPPECLISPKIVPWKEKNECQERAGRREGAEKKNKAIVVLFVFKQKEKLPDLTRITWAVAFSKLQLDIFCVKSVQNLVNISASFMQLFFFLRKLCSDAGYLTDVRKTASKENYRRSLTKFLCRSFVILN